MKNNKRTHSYLTSSIPISSDVETATYPGLLQAEMNGNK